MSFETCLTLPFLFTEMTSWSLEEYMLSCNGCWRTLFLLRQRNVSFTFRPSPSWVTLSPRGASRWTPQGFRCLCLACPRNTETTPTLSWLRKLLPLVHSGFSSLAAPLTSLTSPKVAFSWGPSADQAFERLGSPLLPFFSCQIMAENLLWRLMLQTLVWGLCCLNICIILSAPNPR